MLYFNISIELKKEILKILENYNVNVRKIILFGSRARGDYIEDSDWDILIILEEEIERKTALKIKKEIRKNFAKKLMAIDVIIKCETDVEEYRKLYGSIIKEAMEEGKNL